ncbi:hypothetical protein J3D48_000427 [Pseudomonas fluorescens]|nr:hypothetical protein [Pseudomonas fluorescens]
MDFIAVGQDFYQQSSGGVALILGDQVAAVVSEFGFLQQLAIEIVFIRGPTAIETGFLLNQAIGEVIEVVVLAVLVFDFGEQQARVVVAITQLAAVRIDPAADEMQVISVFVTGDPPKFITVQR